MTMVHKRTGVVENFNKQKIIVAVLKAMAQTKDGEDVGFAVEIADRVEEVFDQPSADVDVDIIHKEVEDQLMSSSRHDVAREYITYRFSHMPNIFRKRTNLKPYEYPDLLEYVDAIRHSYWIQTEFNYSSDIQDYKVRMTETERSIIKRAMVAISQIEVSVKTFWGNIGNILPKPEVAAVGATFAECHVAGTEILTPRGWVDFRYLEEGQEVMQYNAETNEFSPVVPSRIINEPYEGEIYTIDNGTYHAGLTPNHGIIYTTNSDSIKERSIKDIKSFTSSMRLPFTGTLIGNTQELSSIDRLKIAIQADGCIRTWRNKSGEVKGRGNANGVQTYDVTLKKARKKSRLEDLLADTGVAFRRYDLERKEYVKYEIDMPLQDVSYKTFDWVDLSDKSSEWCEEFIQELAEWDGYRLDGKGNAKNCLVRYSTTNKSCADIVQAVGFMAGYRCNINSYIDDRKESYKDVFTVGFTKAPRVSSITTSPSVKRYSGSIHCVTVPTGCIATRLNNKVLISKNSEVRHADAYSNLLELLGLNDEFEKVMEVPAIKARVKYLERSLTAPVNNEDFFKNILLFSVFIENVSLFSQFFIMMSFNKHKNMLKGISNAVQATSKEEDIHAKFGIELVEIIKNERPEFWDDAVVGEIIELAHQALDAEFQVLNWIFENGETEILDVSKCYNFIAKRMDESLKSIGIDAGITYDAAIAKEAEWFDDEVLISSNIDFFNKRSTAYSKKTKAFTGDNLF